MSVENSKNVWDMLEMLWISGIVEGFECAADFRSVGSESDGNVGYFGNMGVFGSVENVAVVVFNPMILSPTLQISAL